MNYLEQLQYVKCNASNYEYIKGSLGSDSPCYPFFSFRTPIFSPFFPHCGAWSQAILRVALNIWNNNRVQEQKNSF